MAAGSSTATRLRRLDEDANIILFERGESSSFANCGLPYHIGNVIKERDSLILVKPETMGERFNVDVRTKNEVIAIDRQNKIVEVKDLSSNNIYKEAYDVLIIATGSSPPRPPIPGINDYRINSLTTLKDMDSIKQLIQTENIRRAAVIGGGFIGVEVAESPKELNCEVALVDMQNKC